MNLISFKILLLSLIILVYSCKEKTVEPEVINYSNSLILYLPFNGNANDESGNGNNATTINASLTTDRFGKSDSAYSFNGNNSYISIPNSTSLTSFEQSISMCAWIKINDWYSGKWAPVFTKSNTSSYGMYTMMVLQTNKLEIILNSYKIWYDYTFQLNNWYFVVFTWDGSYGRYYVNGALIGTNTLTGTMTKDSKPLIIGKDTPEITEYLDGKLDDIRIYNYSISSQMIDSLYHIGGW